MLVTGPRATSASATSSGSRKNWPLALWPERWKFCRAPSITTATRPKSCRPRILIEVSGESPRSRNQTLGRPKKMSDVRFGWIWSSCSWRTELTIANASMVFSIVLVASTVIGSSVCCALAGARPAASISATNETSLSGARSPLVQPPIDSPRYSVEAPRLAGDRGTRGLAGWRSLAPLRRFCVSVAFVNEMYYSCQGNETQVKTALI